MTPNKDQQVRSKEHLHIDRNSELAEMYARPTL